MATMTHTDPSAEYAAFIAKLQAYHQRRGTNFDPEPRVGAKNVNLLDLFNTVVERGGYDVISGEQLGWRKIGQQFNLGQSNLPALAFNLKTAYYKNLAAYEIETVHKRAPPPPSILEETTARGGDLLTRTVDNWNPPRRREAGALGADQSGDSGDDGTPVRDRIESEETPGSGGRGSRRLREAPPQRVLFQPEAQTSRPSRHGAPTMSGPSPVLGPRGASTSHNPSSNPENMSLTVANYEPRQANALTLRPVNTPANDAVGFAKKQKALRDQALLAAGKAVPQPRMMLPGTGFEGPNIYVRCLLALKSGIRAEQDYALHHLVKISMERGDKYRFESFPGLAEALIEKILEVGSLFYHVQWEVVYLDNGRPRGVQTLDGVDGTPDILERIASLAKKDVDDNLQPAEFSDLLLQVNEAALTLRNMVMLEENAHYVSELKPLRDLLSIALNLPKLQSVVELKHYILDIAEQLTKYLQFGSKDPLYLSLLAQVQSPDRGAILTSLRAISRISMNLEATNRLDGIPATTIQSIMDWTMLEDEELVHTCLDFLYQYTAISANVNLLITDTELDPLIGQLVRLLSFGMRVVYQDVVISKGGRRGPAPTVIPPLPQDLLQLLLQMDEPERSSKWLRCLFEEDKDESITQIALWQGYQSRFAAAVQDSGRPLLPAADFIKNVSTTFADKAAAQVQAGPVQKFIIKGIRIRDAPVDLKGKAYTKCRWQTPGIMGLAPRECNEFFMNAEGLYNHILAAHAEVPKNDMGMFVNQKSDYICTWSGCTKYPVPTSLSTIQFGAHVKIHVITHIAASNAASDPTKATKDDVVRRDKYYVTPTDERNDAIGITFTAALVLRNLSRQVQKTEAEEQALKDGEPSWVQRLFRPVESQLWEIMSHNKALAPYLTDILMLVR